MSTEETINVMSQTIEVRLDTGEKLVAMMMLYTNYAITSENFHDVLAKFRDSLGLLKNEIDKLIQKIDEMLSSSSSTATTTV